MHEPREHVAILKAVYAKAILEGRKTVEARLSQSRQPPFGRVRTGDVLWIKVSGGPFVARAEVFGVLSREGLRPCDVARLRREHDHAILGTPRFWTAKRHARYATLLWLSGVEAIAEGPGFRATPGSRAAWHVLEPARA